MLSGCSGVTTVFIGRFLEPHKLWGHSGLTSSSWMSASLSSGLVLFRTFRICPLVCSATIVTDCCVPMMHNSSDHLGIMSFFFSIYLVTDTTRSGKYGMMEVRLRAFVAHVVHGAFVEVQLQRLEGLHHDPYHIVELPDVFFPVFVQGGPEEAVHRGQVLMNRFISTCLQRNVTGE